MVTWWIGIRVLNEFVANSSSVTDLLSIQTCDLTDGVARALSQTITKCPNVDKIFIINCKFDDASLKDIALGIRGLSCLEKLHMWNYSSINSIDIEGAEAIGSLLQDLSGSIVNLKLYNVRFNNESSIQMIVNGLRGNTKLEHLTLSGTGGSSIRNTGCESIATLLQDSTCNITELSLSRCDINNESVTKIMRSLIGNIKLEDIDLSGNNIGRSGCESIATLLQDRNSNINKISLSQNEIDDSCATILAQALVGNNKLKRLDLSGNWGIRRGWLDFIAILTNNFNHTLCSLGEGIGNMPLILSSLLKLNLAVEMEPLFELDSKDDERKPNALPSVIDWFDRRDRESNEDGKVDTINVRTRKLSAIFQFARAMPLKFVPSPSDVLQLHKEARDQLENNKKELESQITTMIKANEELEDKIKVKDKIIKDRLEISDSIGSLTKKRKHGA